MTREPPPRGPRREARPRSLPRLDAGGFTLVEVLVAITVFAVGVLSLASLMPLGTRNISKSADQSRGSELASACAERLLTTPYADSTLAEGTHEDPGNPYEGVYFLRWGVENDRPMAECKRVTVATRWPAAGSLSGASVVVVIPRSGG